LTDWNIFRKTCDFCGTEAYCVTIFISPDGEPLHACGKCLIKSLPVLRRTTFIVVYSLHILTTTLLPVGLFVLGLINRFQTISLILLLAGVWALIGTIFMTSEDARQLRRFYSVFGIILMVLAAFLYVVSLG
jgi:hypothetical protein